MTSQWQGESQQAERLRYRILEHVYLRAGENCGHPVDVAELTRALGAPELATAEAIRALLTRYGFLRDPTGSNRTVCITEEGLRYIRSEAGMRRTVR